MKSKREITSSSMVRTNLLAGLIFLLLLAGIYRTAGLMDIDFLRYWAAACSYLDGRNPYDPVNLVHVQEGAGKAGSAATLMYNPPWILVVLLPFSLFSFELSRLLWLLFLGFVLFWSTDWLWHYYGGDASKRWVAWLTPLWFVPAAHALLLGQISPIILGGVIAFVAAIQRGKYLRAGLAGLLISTKPQLLLIFWLAVLLWACSSRRWRLLAATALCPAAATLILSIRYPRLLPDFLNLIVSGQPLIWAPATVGFFLRAAADSGTTLLQFAPSMLGGASVGMLWIFRWRHSFSWRSQLIPVLLWSTTTTPFAWGHDMTVLLPCIVVVLVWVSRNPWRNCWIVPAILAADVLYVHTLQSTGNAFFTLWVPFVVAAIYLAGRTCNRDHTALVT